MFVTLKKSRNKRVAMMRLPIIIRSTRRAMLAVMLLAGTATAAPVIQQVSGTFDHKGSVTIAGSAFGTKSTAAPVVWDDASGNSILDKWDGAWPDNNATYNTIYRSPMRGTPLPHSHVTRYIAGAHGDGAGADGGYNVIFFKNLNSVALPYNIYASWYQYVDAAWAFNAPANGGPADNNFKTFAYSVCCGPYQMPNNWYTAYGPPHPDSATDVAQWLINDDGSSLSNPDVNGHNFWWNYGTNPTGRWLRVEMAIHLSSGTDGYIKLWENGSLKINYSGATDKYPGNSRTVGIGGYARDYLQPNNWRYFDDVYIDTTLARVVLANNQSLSQATIIEPQIPTSWNATSINFTVNLGKFTNGQTAYLFVVDPSGVSNAVGFPITAGAGATVTAIGPPANLTVQ